MRKINWSLVLAIIVLAALIAAMFGTVRAKNLNGQYDEAPFHEWYESQHNSTGQWCCNNADGHPYYDDYTLNADSSVTVTLNGRSYRIPKEQVLTGPNPTGHAVWWYMAGYNGEPFTYCFAVGQTG